MAAAALIVFGIGVGAAHASRGGKRGAIAVVFCRRKGVTQLQRIISYINNGVAAQGRRGRATKAADGQMNRMFSGLAAIIRSVVTTSM